MKIWVDDIRIPPDGWVWVKSVNEFKTLFEEAKSNGTEIQAINLDHDAGEYFRDGGDYIRILDWLEEKYKNISCRISVHSMNPVGVQQMNLIISKNGWDK